MYCLKWQGKSLQVNKWKQIAGKGEIFPAIFMKELNCVDSLVFKY